MTFLCLSALAVAIMAACAWASNVWPGVETWARAGVSRLLWWGLPFGVIVWLNGAPWDHALWLTAAAWIGAWVPHSRMPDFDAHWSTVLLDSLNIVLRVIVLLTPPAIVFWTCGAYWWAMALAAFSVAWCMWLADRLPHRWIGLASTGDVAGVLFGASVGFWLAVAVWTPTEAPDLLP